MASYYYSAPVSKFLTDSENHILGDLVRWFGNQNLTSQARNAWKGQIKILKHALQLTNEGHLYFEFSIPRMGKRADNVLILRDAVCVIEFKMGAETYQPYVEQVIDYSLDLKNFHGGSHDAKVFPLLVCSDAQRVENQIASYPDRVFHPLFANSASLSDAIELVIQQSGPEHIDQRNWENSAYRPTPTIIEAAQALYGKHTVADITRHEAGAKNLAETTDCIAAAIETATAGDSKCICFVTGVPGAGKTLAGLNIATKFLKSSEDRSVFLSGNGPLVDVLREALARNKVSLAHEAGNRMTLNAARRDTRAFVQNIHHFRDHYLAHPVEVPDRTVVFDEAQRAWTQDMLADFMRRKRGSDNFKMSEPHFLIDVMNRNTGNATIVCLVGGGQEIGRGEAGLSEWIRALRDYYSDWQIYVSDQITFDDAYIEEEEVRQWLFDHATVEADLHLSVPVRSFRSENLANFVDALLKLDERRARELLVELYDDGYPIMLTRNLKNAKSWLRTNSRGTERCGLVASAGAHRLRPLGISVRQDIDAPIWFLNGRDDVRSSIPRRSRY